MNSQLLRFDLRQRDTAGGLTKVDNDGLVSVDLWQKARREEEEESGSGDCSIREKRRKGKWTHDSLELLERLDSFNHV